MPQHLKPLSIYIHIPFCRYKCPYCNFFVRVEAQHSHHHRYVEHLLQEIELFSDLAFSPQSCIQSIYFGGGTPSFVESNLLHQILSALQKKFSWLDNIEISLEANPEDITPHKVAAWQSMGINRVTLGVQSLNPNEIDFLGRGHNQQQALDAIACLNDHGLCNIGIDLIYHLPQQTKQDFCASLDLLFTQSFTHISLYGLTIEPRTPFAKQVKNNQWRPLDEVNSEILFHQAIEYFQHKNFNQYEISNFSIPGFESKHNQCYWQQAPYWGLGASAHSYLPSHHSHAQRWWNPKNLHAYYAMIETHAYPYETEILSLEQSQIEYVYTHLRTDGIALSWIDQLKLDIPKQNQLNHFIQQLTMQGSASIQNNKLCLSPTGQIKSDWICEQIIGFL